MRLGMVGRGSSPRGATTVAQRRDLIGERRRGVGMCCALRRRSNSTITIARPVS